VNGRFHTVFSLMKNKFSMCSPSIHHIPFYDVSINGNLRGKFVKGGVVNWILNMGSRYVNYISLCELGVSQLVFTYEK
jgi:hypothetical protein